MFVFVLSSDRIGVSAATVLQYKAPRSIPGVQPTNTTHGPSVLPVTPLSGPTQHPDRLPPIHQVASWQATTSTTSRVTSLLHSD